MPFKALLLITAMLVLLLPATGCTLFMHSDSTYTPKATGDGSGGAIVVYQIIKGRQRDFYAQRIGAEGDNSWGDKGTLIGSTQGESYSSPVFEIVGDGAGGAIIGWPNLSPNQLRSTAYLTKVSTEGRVLWERSFVSFSHLVSDGSGGAIVAFDRAIGNAVTEDDKSVITLVRVDSGGGYSWGLQGIAIPRQSYWPNSLRLTSDGAGGVVVCWVEMEAEPGSESQNPRYTWRIMTQRVDSAGKPVWGGNSVVLFTSPDDIAIEGASITNDGSGGAIVVWHQYPSGKVVGGSPEWLLQDICVQRISPEGDILWQEGGIPLGIVRTAELASPHTPLVISDDSGGAIIIWEDLRNGLASIYAQRITPDGTLTWQSGGVQVMYIKSNASLAFRQIAADGQGGAIVSCRFNEAGTGKKGILVQKLDSSGKLVWQGSGIIVTGSVATNYSLAPDGRGEAVVSWGVGNSQMSYTQQVSAEGRLGWGNKGIRLNP